MCTVVFDPKYRVGRSGKKKVKMFFFMVNLNLLFCSVNIELKHKRTGSHTSTFLYNGFARLIRDDTVVFSWTCGIHKF